MPYIKLEFRPEMDKVVEALHKDNLYENELVYILFKYCDKYIKPSYNNYKNFCGELCQCATEIERRTGSIEYPITVIDVNNFNNYINALKSNHKFNPFFREEISKKKIEFMKEANIQVNGDLNYILYAFCLRHKTVNEYSIYWNQRRYSKFAKVLRLVTKKIEKEILAPYEDEKIVENGDVL